MDLPRDRFARILLPLAFTGSLVNITQLSGSLTVNTSTNSTHFTFTYNATGYLVNLPCTLTIGHTTLQGSIYDLSINQELPVSKLLNTLQDIGAGLADILSSVGIAKGPGLINAGLRITTVPETISVRGTVAIPITPTIEAVVINPRRNDSLTCVGLAMNATTFPDLVQHFLKDVDLSDAPFLGTLSLPAVNTVYCNGSLSRLPKPVKIFKNFRFNNIIDLPKFRPNIISSLFNINFPRVGMKELFMSLKQTIDFSVSNSSYHSVSFFFWCALSNSVCSDTRLVRTPEGNEKEHVLNRVRSIQSVMFAIGKANITIECTY